MNPLTERDTPRVEADKISGDRRRDARYSITLEVRWKLIRRRKVLDQGLGHTVDLSSGGILIETERVLPPGLDMELSIAWPVMLHNVAPLQLVASGRIVRSNGRKTAIRMTQHEFRTAGIPTEHRAAPVGTVRTPLPFLGAPRQLAGCGEPR